MSKARETPDPLALDPRTNPAARIVRTSFALRYALQGAFRDAGLEATTAEWGMLNMLTHIGSQRVGDIATLSRHDRTTITRIVDGLARRDLVDRTRDPDDRRAVLVEINRKGRALHRKLVPIARGVLDHAFAGVSASRQKALFSTLSRIHDNLLAIED